MSCQKFFAKTFLLFLLVAGQFSELAAQISMKPRTKTRAVVVGISDYQNSQIPDLSYAHRDAQAFAEFLESPGGGSLSSDDLRLLINEEATTANFAAALDWLMAESNEGDQAIVYFSGHGDVETRTRSQLGFLLTWDSPPVTYVAGAFPVYYLQEVISTLSLQNKARVMLITDACHAGKLAGNSVGGSQVTASNLARQFANEIKILSCQPNEYSNESVRWGGGRGVFSWYLVNGLYGMADQNSDQVVNLLEVSRYLEDKVPNDVAPDSQIPMFFGNRGETLAQVDATALAETKRRMADNGTLGFAQKNPKSPRTDSVPLPANLQAMKSDFENAWRKGLLLQPVGGNAFEIYQKFRAQAPQHPVTRQYGALLAAEMQMRGQQTFNNLVLFEVGKDKTMEAAFRKSVQLAGAYFEKSLEILGEAHFQSKSLRAKKTFLDNALVLDDARTGKARPDAIENAVAQSEAVIKTAPDATYIYYMLGQLHLHGLGNAAKGVEFFTRAQELSPNWEAVYTGLVYATERLNKSANPDETDERVGTDGQSNMNAGQDDLKSQTQKADMLFFTGNEKAAAALYRQIAEKHPTNPLAKSNKGLALALDGDFDNAEEPLLNALAAAPEEKRAYSNLVYFYLALETTGQAEQYAQKALKKWPSDPNALYDAARVSSQSGKIDTAVGQLLAALDAGYAWPQRSKNDPAFENLRKNAGAREKLKAVVDGF